MQLGNLLELMNPDQRVEVTLETLDGNGGFWFDRAAAMIKTCTFMFDAEVRSVYTRDDAIVIDAKATY